MTTTSVADYFMSLLDGSPILVGKQSRQLDGVVIVTEIGILYFYSFALFAVLLSSMKFPFVS